MENTNILPTEYTLPYGDGAKFVKGLIEAALDTKGLDADTRKFCRYDVKVTDPWNDSLRMTRVYVNAGWSGRGTHYDKTMLSSKKLARIDIDRVCIAVIEAAKRAQARSASSDVREADRRVSEGIANNLSAELGITYASSVSISSVADRNMVRVEFTKKLTPDQAREVVAFLKNYN